MSRKVRDSIFEHIYCVCLNVSVGMVSSNSEIDPLLSASSSHLQYDTSHSTQNTPNLNDPLDPLHYHESMIKLYMKDRHIEILAIVEGTDATTGGVVQARHSYTLEELKWHAMFEPCVKVDEVDGSAVIDFSVFHQLRKVSSNSTYCGAVSSHL